MIEMRAKEYRIGNEKFFLHYADPEDKQRLFCAQLIYEKKQLQKDGELGKKLWN